MVLHYVGGVLELFSCLNVKITTFELEKASFMVYLIMFSPKENKLPSFIDKQTYLIHTPCLRE